jgi:two-component system cell cycle sensor histidine kinase/response regulator CckA
VAHGVGGAGVPAPDQDVTVSRLAGAIARDVDELLTVILGYAQLSMGRPGAGDPERGEDLRVVQAAGERARALTSRLHTLGGQRVVQPLRLDLGVALHRMQVALEELAGPDVAVDIRPTARPGPVRIDPDLLQQAVGELVTNARDALDGRGTVTLRLRRTALHDGTAGVALVVRDSGRGMAREVLARCRQPLFTTKPPGTNAGLGLAIVDAAVRQAGGQLHLQSAPGGGTTATLALPLACTEADGDQGSKR